MQAMLSKSDHTPEQASERAQSEIALSDIGESDRITIQTKNSTYTFLVTEPTARRGMLSGGVLGDQNVTASLTGAMTKGATSYLSDPARLASGARAIFVISAGDEVRRVITSSIIRLTHDRAAGLP